jgi:hypothetical protein
MKGDMYWKKLSEGNPLPSMKKPCEGCAITSGFYTSYADELLKQPKEIQEKAKKTWFCHDHTNRCCKGLEEYMEVGGRVNE